jgi:hypothetical protein
MQLTTGNPESKITNSATRAPWAKRVIDNRKL